MREESVSLCEMAAVVSYHCVCDETVVSLLTTSMESVKRKHLSD